MNYVKQIYLLLLVLNISCLLTISKDTKSPVIDNVDDVKEFKKILRTKTNVLVCFAQSLKQISPIIKVIRETADIMKGQGTMVVIECNNEGKKLCKKLKIPPEPYILKHYKNGEFNRDYDRKITTNSMVNFMRDPTGDLPWEEDTASTDVVHISDGDNLAKLIKQETKALMVMFYAPWCRFCKTLKPVYVSAAKELKGHSILAAIDVNKPENVALRTAYNITGFPTLLYFKNGVMKYQYEGDNEKDEIVAFMRNPQPRVTKSKDKEWSEEDGDIVYLTSTNFKPVAKEEQSLLIMFYAPWCPHCVRVKPEFEKAAAIMKQEKIGGMLAAIDATKETTIADKYQLKSYPTFKYFSYGEFKFNINSRKAMEFVDFMRNPKQPPPPPVNEDITWSEDESYVVHLTEENFKAFLKKKRHVLLIFYAPWCGHCKRTKLDFMKAAEFYKDDPKVEFAAVDCTTEQNLCASYKVNAYPTMKYISFFKYVEEYNSGRKFDDFKTFIDYQMMKNTMQLSTEIVTQLDDVSFTKTLRTNNEFVILFYTSDCVKCSQMRTEYHKIAVELKNNGFEGEFGEINCDTNHQIKNKYSITTIPTFILFHNGDFVAQYTENFDKQMFRKFVEQTNLFEKHEL